MPMLAWSMPPDLQLGHACNKGHGKSGDTELHAMQSLCSVQGDA